MLHLRRMHFRMGRIVGDRHRFDDICVLENLWRSSPHLAYSLRMEGVISYHLEDTLKCVYYTSMHMCVFVCLLVIKDAL